MTREEERPSDRTQRRALYRVDSVKELREIGQKVFLKLNDKLGSTGKPSASFALIEEGFCVCQPDYPRVSLTIKLSTPGYFIDVKTRCQQEIDSPENADAKKMRLGGGPERETFVFLDRFLLMETAFKEIFRGAFGCALTDAPT